MIQLQIQPKLSLCRFYLRGLCIYSQHNQQHCDFAHGIQDLNYQPWKEGEPVEVDYLQETQFCQKKAKKGPKTYINLYQFQTQTTYTLEQLNAQRLKRLEVRNEMHKTLFNEFIQLIENVYKQANLTEQVLLREYTRVGFNKLMTRIKFSHLTNYICEGTQPNYYLKSLVMPPLLTKQQNFIFRRAPEPQIIECYRQEYKQILSQTQQKVDEVTIKKRLFKMDYPNNHIPPLNQVLKEKKLSFTAFLQVLSGKADQLIAEKVKLEPTLDQITNQAVAFLQSLGGRVTNWNQIFSYLSKKLKVNNGNLINQVRPLLVGRGYNFLFFPMLQLVLPRSNQFQLDNPHLCNCKYQSKFDLSAYDQILQQQQAQLAEGESVDIYDWKSLLRYGKCILQSNVLGVDLEGNLRKGGFVEMLQLNNSKNTFLIDYYQLDQNKDDQTIQLINQIIRNVFVDANITKIFHDSRHDSLALHECLQTCIVNVFDTSAVQTLKGQLSAYQTIDLHSESTRQAENTINQSKNVKTYGLNDILKKYSATHGPNKHKDRFHKMWKEGLLQIFLLRPIHPDFRDYCIRDVLDLPEVYQKMSQQMCNQTQKLAKWISAHYITYGYSMTSEAENIPPQNPKLQ